VTTYLYEKDLVPQKYRILVARRHDTLVRKIAAELDIPVQELRRYLIENLDMMLLENLPARAEMADAHADQDDPVARALGREKYTLYLQIISRAAMESIFHAVSDHVRGGTTMEDAIAYGRQKIREELRR
jgi:energy-converting hydrogenase A subunit M